MANNQRPQIKLTVPATAKVGEPIPIDPSGSIDPDGQIVAFDAGVLGAPLAPVSMVFHAPGAYEVHGTITDQEQKHDRATAIVTVTEAPLPVAITIEPTTLGALRVGEAVDLQLTALGGVAPYGFACAPGSAMPPGLALSTSGRVTGTPTTAGAYAVEVVATDAAANVGALDYTGSVDAATPPPMPIGTAPTIAQQPQSVTVQWGQQAMVSVAADGTEPLSYQWYAMSSPIAGQTNQVLQFVPTSNLSVSCRVQNAAGAIMSAAAAVIVQMPVPPPSDGRSLRYLRTLYVPSCWANFCYGDCTGRVGADGKFHILFTGDQVNQGSPIYEFVVGEGPNLTWAGAWDKPYGGKRGTWVQQATLEQDVDRLHEAIGRLSSHDPGEILKVIREFGTDVTIEKAANALAITLGLLAETKKRGKPKSEWVFQDFDGAGWVPMVNGGHLWVPGEDFLIVGYGDTYNVTNRPDCNLVGLRLHDDGTTEAFGPWRTHSRVDYDRYGPRAGGPSIDPRDPSKMLISGGMTSGNASCPWGANLSGGGKLPTAATPTTVTLEESLSCLDNYLYSYPMIDQFTDGVPSGPIKSMRRGLHPAVGEWSGGGTELFADPAKNNGVGSWTDNDGQAGVVPLLDRVIFGALVSGSPIQDPTNPLAAHTWYSTVLNNFTCAHGIVSPIQITGPVSTAKFAGVASYPWALLNQVFNKEIPDYAPEPTEWLNLQAEFGILTADIGSLYAKDCALGPVHEGKLYCISHCANSKSVPGLQLPVIHEFELR